VAYECIRIGSRFIRRIVQASKHRRGRDNHPRIAPAKLRRRGRHRRDKLPTE
jgi:hypothetical protein